MFQCFVEKRENLTQKSCKKVWWVIGFAVPLHSQRQNGDVSQGGAREARKSTKDIEIMRQ